MIAGNLLFSCANPYVGGAGLLFSYSVGTSIWYLIESMLDLSDVVFDLYDFKSSQTCRVELGPPPSVVHLHNGTWARKTVPGRMIFILSISWTRCGGRVIFLFWLFEQDINKESVIMIVLVQWKWWWQLALIVSTNNRWSENHDILTTSGDAPTLWSLGLDPLAQLDLCANIFLCNIYPRWATTEVTKFQKNICCANIFSYIHD